MHNILHGSNFGQMEPLSMELAALEYLKKLMSPRFLGCY